MTRFIRYFREESVLLVILLLAAALRFYDYAGFSYSNDELSALFRTVGFHNLKQLIEGGVLTDRHPAGVQVFLYYWVNFFGNSEASLRFPFVLTGIFSVLFAYLVAARWFNKVAGLFAASAVAFLKFTILFSQIARPYSPGLLLSLVMVWFWTRLLFPNSLQSSRNLLMNSIGYSLMTASCMYVHYFCGLFAIIVAGTGLLYLNRSILKYYLPSLAVSAILFIPHVPITLSHMSHKGLGEWLGKPDKDWIWNHIRYIFNDSSLLLLVLGLFFLGSLIYYRRQTHWNKFQFICIAWFLIPALTGYFYSVYINPVLQNSLLIFSFPYLVFFLVSWVPDTLDYKKLILLSAFTLFGTFDTVFMQDYYREQHFGEFRGVAEKINTWNLRYGIDKITQCVVVNNPWYIHYYLDKSGFRGKFEQYDNRGGKDLLAMKKIVEKSNTPYFIYAWTKPAPDEINDIILSKYPYILEKQNFDDLSQVSLFGRRCSTGRCLEEPPLKELRNDFEKFDLWGEEEHYKSFKNCHSGKYAILMDSVNEFGPVYESVLEKISCWPFRTIKVKCWGYIAQTPGNTQLVVDLESADGKPYGWASSNFNLYLENGKWGQVYFTYKIPEDHSEKDKLKIYVWNPGKKVVYIDDLDIRFYP